METSSEIKDFSSKKANSKSAKKANIHPPTAVMVLDSIKALKTRRGASVQAIRKYIEDHYRVNMKVMKPHLNKYFKKAVTTGILQQISGTGANGRFKITKVKNRPKSKKFSPEVKIKEPKAIKPGTSETSFMK